MSEVPTGPELPHNEQPVLREVGSWAGVTLHRGDHGETSARLDRVEIGHMHGPDVAHLAFPTPLWQELVREEIVSPHPAGIEGWGARRIRTAEDIAEVVDLFRLNYERFRIGSAPRRWGRTQGESRGEGQGRGRGR